MDASRSDRGARSSTIRKPFSAQARINDLAGLYQHGEIHLGDLAHALPTGPRLFRPLGADAIRSLTSTQSKNGLFVSDIHITEIDRMVTKWHVSVQQWQI